MKRFFWLASYLKSGNTWMRLALASLRAGGAAVDINRIRIGEEFVASDRSSFDWVAEVESTDLTEREILAARPAALRLLARSLSGPVFRKVHEAFLPTPAGEPLFPADVTLGAVLIVRDPRDVAVSLAHHTGRSIDRTITLMADPRTVFAGQRRRADIALPQPALDWSGHTESWLDRPDFPVELVRYEDMQADLPAVLRRVAAAADLPAPDAAVQGAVEATRFDRLRAQEEEKGFNERPAQADRFFRRGVAGGWRDTLTPAQADRIVADHRRVMARLGYV